MYIICHYSTFRGCRYDMYFYYSPIIPNVERTVSQRTSKVYPIPSTWDYQRYVSH